MTLALRYLDEIHNIVLVDNALINTTLLSNFRKYIQSMTRIEQPSVNKLSKAD